MAVSHGNKKFYLKKNKHKPIGIYEQALTEVTKVWAISYGTVWVNIKSGFVFCKYFILNRSVQVLTDILRAKWTNFYFILSHYLDIMKNVKLKLVVDRDMVLAITRINPD